MQNYHSVAISLSMTAAQQGATLIPSLLRFLSAPQLAKSAKIAKRGKEHVPNLLAKSYNIALF